MTPDEITAAQRRLYPTPLIPRSRAEYRRVARWWELEARRGHESSEDSRQYAATMRWGAELAGLHGPGTLPELKRLAGGGR